ncbi:myosin-binding protein 2 isoform X2 [Corylus avellana]|uniref:myosin-binding protein 2 isoform X2 n=1 Tax=Corylus avellana TaxID=13451 RepID=UPI00286C612A|nr:myosin-binding protein 2 isoform X2 [Corylus avellana]
MAANKFATMLHRNTNKITLTLIYAILEWILIVLLLLNSLFSYLIVKFADYFGLQKPCLWCSRLDHILEPGKYSNSYRDLVCEAHASEISKLGYCLNHRKLAESRDMCEDCSSSSQPDSPELSKRFAFFPWMNKIGLIQNGDEKVSENGERNFSCSCCGVLLDSKFYSPCILIKPSWGDSDYTQKQNLTEEPGVDAQIDEGDYSDRSGSDFAINLCEDAQSIEESRGIQMVSDDVVDDGSGRKAEETEETCSVCDSGCKELVADEDGNLNMVMEKKREPVKVENLNVSTVHVNCSTDRCPEILPQHLEFYIDHQDCRLIPVELIGSAAVEEQGQPRYNVEDQGNCNNQDVILDFDMHVEEQAEPVVENWHNLGETVALLSKDEVELLESLVLVESDSISVLHTEEKDLVREEYEQVATTEATQTPSKDDDHEDQSAAAAAATARKMYSDAHRAPEEAIQMRGDEFKVEISIGTEIPDQEPLDEAQTQEFLPLYEHRQEDPSTSAVLQQVDDDNGSGQTEEEMLEFKTMSVETKGLHHLHKKLLLLERKESGTEESLDGSVISEIEGGELTVEKLISALRAERKALNALYAELDEERSSSAVATNQTMAMINRLQEEKAAMQMEALHYQRMMEEQSEYDQEALQLLNELMVKREKEKQEVEKELEVYRKKVQEYESKENIMMSRRRRDSSTRSTGSCSNAEDSDVLSIDLNHGAKEEDSFFGSQESSNLNTPADAVLYLEESLANFEEERQSILQQLKKLEDKLFTLSDEEEQHFEDVKPVEYSFQQNGNGYHKNSDSESEENGVENGHSKEMNGKHHQERRIRANAKRLLPLFDAIGTDGKDGKDGLVNGHHEEGFDSVALQKSLDTEFQKKVAIEEEVDHVYERLQALEADREFLKHCISSLRKGDKGLDLLQEILENLRDLRSVELRVRNMGDGVLYSL